MLVSADLMVRSIAKPEIRRKANKPISTSINKGGRRLSEAMTPPNSRSRARCSAQPLHHRLRSRGFHLSLVSGESTLEQRDPQHDQNTACVFGRSPVDDV